MAVLIDGHCHLVLPGDLDRRQFEPACTEADRPAPPGTSHLDSQLGPAVRRWCAPPWGWRPYRDRRVPGPEAALGWRAATPGCCAGPAWRRCSWTPDWPVMSWSPRPARRAGRRPGSRGGAVGAGGRRDSPGHGGRGIRPADRERSPSARRRRRYQVDHRVPDGLAIPADRPTAPTSPERPGPGCGAGTGSPIRCASARPLGRGRHRTAAAGSHRIRRSRPEAAGGRPGAGPAIPRRDRAQSYR